MLARACRQPRLRAAAGPLRNSLSSTTMISYCSRGSDWFSSALRQRASKSARPQVGTTTDTRKDMEIPKQALFQAGEFSTACVPPERNLHHSTISKGGLMERIEKSVEVKAPVNAVYNQWTQFEEFPRFMAGVKEVKALNGNHLREDGELSGMANERDSENTRQVADRNKAGRRGSGAAPHARAVRVQSAGP